MAFKGSTWDLLVICVLCVQVRIFTTELEEDLEEVILF